MLRGILPSVALLAASGLVHGQLSLIHTIPVDAGPVQVGDVRVAISDRYMAVGHSNHGLIRVYDTDGFGLLHEFAEGDVPFVHARATDIALDDRRMAVRYHSAIWTYDLATGEYLASTYIGEKGEVAIQGPVVVAADLNYLHFINSANGVIQESVSLDPSWSEHDPDCEIEGNTVVIAAIGDWQTPPEAGRIHVYDVDTRALRHAFGDGAPWWYSNSLSLRDGQLACAAVDDLGNRRLNVLDVHSGALLHDFELPEFPGAQFYEVADLDLSSEHLLAQVQYKSSTSWEHVLYWFDLATGSMVERLYGPDGHRYHGECAILGSRVLAVDNHSYFEQADLQVFDAGYAVGTSYCGPAQVNSTGAPAELSATGSNYKFHNDLRFIGTQLPANKPGLVLAAQTQGLINPPGSQGTLCLGAGISRLSPWAVSSSSGEYQVAWNNSSPMHGSGGQAVQVGETWNFQLWYRDGSTSNFTDALTITFE